MGEEKRRKKRMDPMVWGWGNKRGKGGKGRILWYREWGNKRGREKGVDLVIYKVGGIRGREGKG